MPARSVTRVYGIKFYLYEKSIVVDDLTGTIYYSRKPTKEETINHYPSCKKGESKRWEKFYKEQK